MNTKEWTIFGTVAGVGGLILYIRNRNAQNDAAQSPDENAMDEYEMMAMLSALGNGYGTQQSDSTQPVAATDQTGTLVNSILNGNNTGNSSDSNGSTNSDSGTGHYVSSGGNPITAQPVGPEPVPVQIQPPTNSSTFGGARFGGLRGVGTRVILPS